MKVQCQLQGTFHRIMLSGTDSMPVSLVDLIREVQAQATETRRRSPQLLRQSFGLNFLLEPVLINLLKQAQGVEIESELYQVPSLQLLHKVRSHLTLQVANTYRYQFISPEATFNLTPDNPQIPAWVGSDSAQSGNYTVTLEQPDYPGLSHEFASNLWLRAQSYWQTLPDIQKIHLALQSLDILNYKVHQPQTPHLQIWISLQDLPIDLRAAITFLRLGEGETSVFSAAVRLLVQQYQATYRLPIVRLPEQLSPDSITPAQGLRISKGNSRSILEKIISTARNFLLISSYIIEDEHLTELICRKSQELPQGVWILTDLRNLLSLQPYVNTKSFDYIIELLHNHQIFYKKVTLSIAAIARIVSQAIDTQYLHNLASSYPQYQFALITQDNIFSSIQQLLPKYICLNPIIHNFDKIWQEKSLRNFPLFGIYLDKIEFAVVNSVTNIYSALLE
ncbi:MAG: hypothetical protein PUP93_05815 [Rhizonema sp. NSF051]|nr:hypothetical protein [Rhizonema sp. NSF051]